MTDIENKIVPLSENTYYIPNSTNVGVIVINQPENEDIVYLIDSGPSEIEAEYVLDVLEAFFKNQNKKYRVKAVIATHGHPDHTGGHHFIKERSGCELWISKKERCFMEMPELHGSILWGSSPPKELRTLYFCPEAAEADRTLEPGEKITLEDGRILELIGLYGHCPEILGVLTYRPEEKEKVLFSGDAIFPAKELARYWIPLITEPALFLRSLDVLENTDDVKFCVPSHGPLISVDYKETIELNKIAILSTKQCILNALKSGKKTTEEIVKYVADYHSLEMKIPQYALITTTVKSYLASMQAERKVRLFVEDNILYYALKNE